MNSSKSILSSQAKSFPQRKEAKEITNNHIPYGQIDKWTNEGSTPLADPQGANGKVSSERNAARIANAQIDALLSEFQVRGWIDPNFIKWHAKGAHTLGLDAYNKLAIECADAQQPARLFSYKLKGALALHAKHRFYSEQRS